MEKLIVKGSQEFMGKEIPVVEGGFGEGQRVVLAKTIAEIHDTRPNDIQDLINTHLDEFEIGVDLLDLLKVTDSNGYNLENLGFTKMQIAKSKNIYLLSEQGYMLLVGFMNTEKAKAIRKQLRREYFAMRKVINEHQEIINKAEETKYLNAKARYENSKTKQAKLYIEMSQNTNDEAEKKMYIQKAFEVLNNGNKYIPKNVSETLSAEDIAKKLKTTATKIGKLANAHNLKTARYGVYTYAKGKYNDNQYRTFRYYPEAVKEFERLLKIN